MEKLILNVSMNKFILRLILITHILLTMKLPSSYLGLYTDLTPRLIYVIIMVIIMYYDLLSGALAGIVLILNNLEYIERQKILNLV
jgi:hypothetical protein